MEGIQSAQIPPCQPGEMERGPATLGSTDATQPRRNLRRGLAFNDGSRCVSCPAYLSWERTGQRRSPAGPGSDR